MTDTPDTSEIEEPIIELIETIPVGYIILAFVIGAALVAAAVIYLGRKEPDPA
jgi:hypothetical protein